MDATAGASAHHLVEFLTAMSRCGTSEDATRTATELAAESFDAEVGAVVIDGALVTAVGFGQERNPSEVLIAVSPGAGSVDLPEIGPCHYVAANWKLGTTGRLIVARTKDPFDLEDRNLMLGMASSLGLALDLVDVMDRQRSQQRVLEVLLDIQRAIAHREPLPTVLAAITEGAGRIVAGQRIALVLDDTADPGHPIVTGEPVTGHRHTVSVPVHIHGKPVGALVASRAEGVAARPEDDRLLQFFAEHASLALADARAVEAIQESYRDPLTGLPNRRLFLDRLAHALADPSTRPSVLFIDLDRFKAVNDTLGHAAGDTLLRAAAERILSCVDPGATTARFGGDEFAVMVTDAVDEAIGLADRIIERLRAPFTIDGRVFYIGATVGIAHGPGERTRATPDELLGNADLAMYRAKAAGGSASLTYQPQMRAELLDRLELEAHLQSALERHELSVHYQPIVELESGRAVAVEALLRWHHPRRGFVAPLDFIPIAELTGSIIPIGRWVLETACRQVACWRDRAPALALHVNVSARQLRDRDFTDDVRYALRLADLPGEALVIELTESVLIEEDEPVLESLNRLRELGVAIALDDFGTGFSSLARLDRIPVDVLKIDRSFISGTTGLTTGTQLIRTVLDLGRGYDLDVVAEGVEDEQQRRRLIELGCTTGQGFLFARPGPPQAVFDLVAGDTGPTVTA